MITAIDGEVPEFNGFLYLGLIASNEAIEKKRPLLLAMVRALTRGMKFIKDNPAEAAHRPHPLHRHRRRHVQRNLRAAPEGLPQSP